MNRFVVLLISILLLALSLAASSVTGFLLPSNSVAVKDQAAGVGLLIDLVSLKKGGFVVVKKADYGKVAGETIARSGFLPAGTYYDISLAMDKGTNPIRTGESVFIVIYEDAGAIEAFDEQDIQKLTKKVVFR
jgi:hypothetical protein